LVFALALGAGSASPAAAQAVTTTDVQRLQDSINDASRAVGQMRSRDASAASQLQAELDEASDEAAYLKVKLRKNEPIARREYTEVRDRVENIRNRASGVGSVRPQNPNEIPVGTEFDVRLQNSLTSKTAEVEDRFEATTMVDLQDERGRVLVPAGSVMRGVVSSVNPATRMDRKGSLTVAFDRITIDGRSYPIRATVSQALESEGIMGEKAKIGIGAGAGAILGAILGGTKGAIAGILIGGGGTIAATEGKDVELPSGTVLRVRMDSPLNLR
jgi:TolA-binding protein